MARITKERYAELDEKALELYREHVGKLLECDYLCGYVGDDSTDVQCVPPCVVRVLETREEDVCHWNDEWLDPYWDVEFISGPEQARSLRSIWIDGPSINAETGEVQWNGIRPVTEAR